MTNDARPGCSIKSIFTAARRIQDLAERQAYLDLSCGCDAVLRRELEEMFAGNFRSANLLDAAVDHLQPNRTVIAGYTDTAAIDVSSHPMIGPYTLLERIGEGGMGTVFMAEQKAPIKRKVALKLIKPGMDSREVVARFEAERQALAMMNHPNIARIFDAGVTEQGRPYFVMELVRGFSIDQYCDDATLPLTDRLKLFIDVCRAVQHAHQKGIIHRDLKPSNILITLHDGVPVVKVIDFGIAKALDQELTERTLFTRFAELIGTPVYMSPEQAEMSGLDIDTRSDVYSLGVVLYKLLVGVTPFDESTLKSAGLNEMRRIIREDAPVRPSHKVSTLDNERISTISLRRGTDPRSLSLSMQRELDWIVMKALEKDRNRRYESASAVAADIQRYLNNEPVEAFPPSAAYRLRKLAVRNKAALITTAIVVTSLLLGTGVSLWQAVAATDARRLADERFELAELERRNAIKEKALAETQRRRSRVLLYVSDMKLASDALCAGDVPRVANLLERHHPQQGEEDLRDFAWCFLNKSVDVRQNWRIDAGSRVWGVVASPDGKQIAVATGHGQVQVYRSSSGEWLQSYQLPCECRGVAWAPDGKQIVSAGSDGSIRVWDFHPNRASLERPDNESRLLSSIIDVVANVKPAITFFAHPGGVMSVCYSPDGETIVSGGYDAKIGTWEANSGKQRNLFEAHQRELEAVCVSPDGTLIASASADDRLSVWDFDSGEHRHTWRSPSLSNMLCVDFSPDGTCVAAGDNYGNILLADVHSGATVTAREPDTVYDIAFLRDSTHFATCDRGGAVRVWSWNRDADNELQLSSRAQSRWQAARRPDKIADRDRQDRDLSKPRPARGQLDTSERITRTGQLHRVYDRKRRLADRQRRRSLSIRSPPAISSHRDGPQPCTLENHGRGEAMPTNDCCRSLRHGRRPRYAKPHGNRPLACRQ